MRCPACGATNPDQAPWCGQCYHDLREPTPPAAGPAPPAGEPGAPPVPPATDPSVSGFRRVGDRVEWTCVRCGTSNDIDELHCGVCGAPISARYEEPEREPEPREWTTALALSAVIPGAGHIALGRHGTGIARALLFATWLVGGVVLAGAGGAAAAAPLYLGAAVLWAGSLLDLHLLRRGARELLAGRTLLWLVVGVLVLTGVGMFAAAANLPGAGDAGAPLR
jgi:TM2 domain-containing membrane protein YozV